MVRLFLVPGLIAFLLFACSSPPLPTSTPMQNIVLEPSAAPIATVISSPLPTQVLPTIPPTPTTDPNFFRDDFNNTLDTQWSWVREDPLSWDLVSMPGSLQINVGGGSVPAHNNSNLLLRPGPAGNFQIETRIAFKPMDNFQFAGLIIYESDSNFIQAGRGYCSSVGCIGEGLYMDYYRKGVAVGPYSGPIQNDIDLILLRLSRRGNTYSFAINTDGKVWFVIGSYNSDISPLQIGLVAGQNLEGSILPAAFDYFEVRSLP